MSKSINVLQAVLPQKITMVIQWWILNTLCLCGKKEKNFISLFWARRYFLPILQFFKIAQTLLFESTTTTPSTTRKENSNTRKYQLDFLPSFSSVREDSLQILFYLRNPYFLLLPINHNNLGILKIRKFRQKPLQILWILSHFLKLKVKH